MIDAAGLFALQWVVVFVASRQLQAAGMVEVGPCDVDPAFVCEGPNGALWAILLVFVVVSTFAYHTWFDGVLGATPGKRWMGLAVVGRDADDGAPVGVVRGIQRAVIRQGVWVWAFLFLGVSPIAIDVASPVWFGTFGLSLLTFVWGAYSASGHALHDRVAGTSVVLASSIPSPAAAEPIEATP